MKNLSQAGKYLFVSQSTLSKAIQGLENELGLRLIYFSGKKMYLTSYGAHLYNMAQNMLEQYDEIVDTMHGLSHLKKGVIKIGVPPIIGTCVFPNLIAGFIEKYPGIEFVIDQYFAYNVQQLVDKKILEIGFTILPTISDSFDTINIINSKYVVVVNRKNPLSSKTSVHYSDLIQEKFILLGEEFRLYNDIIVGCRLADFEPRVIMRLSDWDLILQLVILNMGISILPYPIINMFSHEDFAVLELLDPNANWDVIMITPKNHYETVAVKAFKEHILEVTKDIT